MDNSPKFLHDEIDPLMDYLYTSNVRCPYCRGKILKYTTTCPRCGVQKQQIHHASNKQAKEIMRAKRENRKKHIPIPDDKKGLIFLTRRRPLDVTFTSMAMISFFGGLFGAHSFYVGRRARGWFAALCAGIGLLGYLPIATLIWWRKSFTDMNLIDNVAMFAPTDLLFIVAFFMWIYDFSTIACGYFKYPIRLGELVQSNQKVGTRNAKK
jgi:TM2 domain-containing membrane protein YozV